VSNGTKAKRQSPVRGSAVYRHVSGFDIYCLILSKLCRLIPKPNQILHDKEWYGSLCLLIAGTYQYEQFAWKNETTTCNRNPA
jgi:hypothetical protein